MYPSGSCGEIDYVDNGLITINEDKTKLYKKGFKPFPVYRILDKIIKKAPTDFSAGPDMNNLTNLTP